MPLNFQSHRLANGLQILAEENPDSHSFAAGLFVRTGARDEDAGLSGVSHFLEHMMFKGSAQYTWEDVNRIFDEMGARYNAFTTEEMTAYYANVLPEFTDRTIEHLSNLLRPAIRPGDFDTEKKVILEEIAMYLDDPNHRIYEALMHEHFGAHPLSRSVLGTIASITALQRDAMADYFARHYGPGNMVLSVTGRLDFSRVVELAQKYCGAWERAGFDRPRSQPALRASEVHLTDPKLSRKYTMGMTDGPSAQDERRYAARVLAEVIGDAEGSRFYWSLVDNAIAEEADFGFYPHDGCGSFYIALVTEPDRAERALEIARNELRKVRSDLTDEEVERAKNKISSSIVLQGEAPMGRMRAIASNWIYNGEYRSLEDDMATLASLTGESLRSLMADFPFEKMTVVTLGPPAN
ncbi:MAG TPA: pitrilysin family protein [Tepidisphaeraceae bacterium]|nr:pitrilysin family protein [Tepidisphaeraceae bacterium]